LSLAVAAIPGWIVSLWDFSAIYTLRHMRAHKGACIRNADALQRLAETDVMFLFGKPMITDGLLHVSAVFSDGSLHFGKRLADPACAALTERALMMLRERERYPVSDAVFFDPLYGLYRKELLQYATFVKADAEMLRIRYRALSYRPSAAKHPTEALEYEDTVDGSRHILLCSPDDLLFIRCTHWYKNGKLFPMTFEKRSEIKKELHTCIAKGCVVRSYAERAPGEEIVFLGFIACSERIPKGTREGVTALNASGVRTVLCMRDESSENLHYALSSGCARTPSEVARASEFRKQNRAVTDGFGTYTAYLGFSDEELMMLLSDLSTHGIRTCGIALERSDEPLLRSTALMLACGDESNLSRKSGRKELTELPVEGLGCAKDATGRMRLCSDGLVRRAGSGGGIPELYQAVRSARTLQRNRRTLISYLLYSFSVRFGIALPALWGLSGLSLALSSLFVGLILDLCMGALIVMNAREGDVMSGGEIDLENTSKPLKRIAVLTVSGALSGTVLSLLPFFFPMIGIAVSAAINAAFRTCAAIGLSLSFFLRLRHKNTERAFDIPATVLLSGTVLAVIASFLFPAFGALIGIPAFPESAMLFWPIALLLPWILPFRIR
ncbi:MAG: hypothetical protein J6B77_01575, partial [Clostridia bacterium]|nr:hypothetical protein [Clostridia bacterium]